MSYGKAVFE